MHSLLDLIRLPEEEKKFKGLLYTPSEIEQQPRSWLKTLSEFSEQAAALRTFLESCGVRAALNDRPTILLTGAGTSDYIGQALSLLLREQWGCEVLAVASTDLLTSFDAYLVPGRQYLCVSFSRSGDSPEGVAAIEHASRHWPEMAQLVVTCNRQSRMYALGHAHPRGYVAVLDDAVNDRSLAMTSSFTNMVVYGQCLAHLWSLENYAPVLHAMARAGERLLPGASAKAGELAARAFHRVCFVGSDALAAAARESALKVLEMSGGVIGTMSETVLGLRHGPMAALTPETLFVCFLANSASRQPYELDLLREVAAKGIAGDMLVIGLEGDRAAIEEIDADSLFIAGTVPDSCRVPLDVMFGQLLGLYCSLRQGMKPDAPSPGGVISRVVQDFRMYR